MNTRELLKRSLNFMSVVGCSNDDVCQLCDEIEDYLAQLETQREPVFLNGDQIYNVIDKHWASGGIEWGEAERLIADVQQLILKANGIGVTL
jgi:hypothetical protein